MAFRQTFLFLLCIASGCATNREEAIILAQNAGWQWETLTTKTFDLAAATAPQRRGETIWVYIEGDGLAFLTPTRPSLDPTPSDPVALRLALSHSVRGHSGNDPTAYLARPCQYVFPEHRRGCNKHDWTDGRYAPKIVASISEAVNSLKEKAGASRVVLVGYSGGGALALLVAATRNDVAGIVTVAANLDLAYWTRRNGLTPLAGSLDPAHSADAVAAIPQIHFTGELDEVAGPDVVLAFTNRLPEGSPTQVIIVPGFTHTCCWVDKWGQLVKDLPFSF